MHVINDTLVGLDQLTTLSHIHFIISFKHVLPCLLESFGVVVECLDVFLVQLSLISISVTACTTPAESFLQKGPDGCVDFDIAEDYENDRVN